MALAAIDDLHLNQSVGEATMAVSGGQAQRIGLARAFYRAITLKTDWILLDEPISALDADRSQRVSESLRRLTQKGVTVVAVSHQPIQQADFMVEVRDA
jgi:ATP-binding cassette subfamily C protein CydD